MGALPRRWAEPGGVRCAGRADQRELSRSARPVVMKIAHVVYPDFTALDLVGPYEVISRWPQAEVHFLARSLEPVRCDRGLTVIPTDTPDTLPDPDLIVVPGSQNPLPVLGDEVLVEWLRRAAPGCDWT